MKIFMGLEASLFGILFFFVGYRTWGETMNAGRANSDKRRRYRRAECAIVQAYES